MAGCKFRIGLRCTPSDVAGEPGFGASLATVALEEIHRVYRYCVAVNSVLGWVLVHMSPYGNGKLARVWQRGFLMTGVVAGCLTGAVTCALSVLQGVGRKVPGPPR